MLWQVSRTSARDGQDEDPSFGATTSYEMWVDEQQITGDWSLCNRTIRDFLASPSSGFHVTSILLG
jgi:hypothetical protein